MPTLRCTVAIEADGRPLDDAPIVVTVTGQVARPFSHELQPGGGMTILALFQDLRDLTGLAFTTTGPCDFFLNGQSGGGVPLLAGAVVVLGRLTDCDGFPLVGLLNSGGEACRVRGVALGTAV